MTGSCGLSIPSHTFFTDDLMIFDTTNKKSLRPWWDSLKEWWVLRLVVEPKKALFTVASPLVGKFLQYNKFWNLERVISLSTILGYLSFKVNQEWFIYSQLWTELFPSWPLRKAFLFLSWGEQNWLNLPSRGWCYTVFMFMLSLLGLLRSWIPKSRIFYGFVIPNRRHW